MMSQKRFDSHREHVKLGNAIVLLFTVVYLVVIIWVYYWTSQRNNKTRFYSHVLTALMNVMYITSGIEMRRNKFTCFNGLHRDVVPACRLSV